MLSRSERGSNSNTLLKNIQGEIGIGFLHRILETQPRLEDIVNGESNLNKAYGIEVYQLIGTELPKTKLVKKTVRKE